MTVFFDRLELQRRYDLQEITVGAAIGVLVAATITKYTTDPSVLGYLPTVLGAVPGASVIAGIIERREQQKLEK